MNNINLSEKDTNSKDTEVAPFNAKNILPESRGMKPISQLLEYIQPQPIPQLLISRTKAPQDFTKCDSADY